MTDTLLLEPSTHALFLCALGCQCLGAHMSIAEGLVVTQAAEGFKKGTLIWVIALPLVGSVVLLLVFFLLNIMKLLLLGFLAFASVSSTATLWYPNVRALVDRAHCPYPKALSLAVCISAAGAAGVWWAATRNWQLSNALALHLAVAAIGATRLPSGKWIALLLALFFAYDVFWVFLSPLLFGGSSVMETVAIGLLPSSGDEAYPILLTFPRVIESGFNVLGLGDLILPGVYLSYLYRMDILKKHLIANGMRQRHARHPWLEYYFPVSVAVYILALVLTMVMLMIMQTGQPALLYIVPAILASSLGQAALAKPSEVNDIWLGEFTARIPRNTAVQEPDDTHVDAVLDRLHSSHASS